MCASVQSLPQIFPFLKQKRNNIKDITLIGFILFTALCYAQVGINTNSPDAASALEIESITVPQAFFSHPRWC